MDSSQAADRGFRASGVPRYSAAALLPTLLVLARISAGADFPLITWQGETMGSVYTVKVVGTNLAPENFDALKKEVDARLKEINRQMSHYEPESELSRFNRAPANTPCKISAEFARVLRFALELNRDSGGAFDPTLGPVINLWGFGEQTPVRRTPSSEQLAEAMKKTGCQHLSLSADNVLRKDIPGLQLNLSAIAKGFGSDEIARVLVSHGLTNHYVAISGEVVTLGHNARGTKWQVGISAPIPDWREGDPLATVLPLSGQAISTSGDYQKFFIDGAGRQLGHIFDPKTGQPVQNNVGSVSVVAENCMTADALAKPLFVMGVEAGSKWIESRTNASALFIVREEAGKFRIVTTTRFPKFEQRPE
jgi:FAD:protein FMN transferase